ncbi:protein-L-isoaspartate O-methyltransferase family protein [Myceligenerans xiligouense]|uniref:Protein-L-isoaspartate O-methyltransferase n=1 Tax=Myceligenerans xiligouense TaxID=253184 RepID=A0A3N4YPS5_9MICO|nr:protein-L-isoaspartate carboxylmethyltransferase [Myceligenerans xiligouense]RPF20480.1 protein-L-isoaspartate(D-aspartate) O-methyltransferase [Myceligenerans xiligouense]
MADDAVAHAMHAVPRSGFLPRAQRPAAGADRPLPIGQGQTSSQPSTVADMLRMLRVPRRARVLDIGAGSGWTTALLAHLTGPDGEVLGIERHARLAEWGHANVTATGMGWARVAPARPGTLGAPRPGGWDRILVSAAAERLPQDLVDQLAPGGLMVIPVRGRMLLVSRRADGDVHVSEHGGYRFVPLIEG